MTGNMDEVVSFPVLRELSRKVGHSWKNLGRCLLLHETDLEDIQMDRLSMQESTYQMFLLWRSMNGHFATYTRLSVALRQSGRPDLSEETVLIAGCEEPANLQSGRTCGFGKFEFEVAEMLSLHDVLSLSEYFNIPPAVMNRCYRSKYPGLYLLSELEDRSVINRTSVSRLVDALHQCGSHHTATLVKQSYQDNLFPREGSSSDALKGNVIAKAHRKSKSSVREIAMDKVVGIDTLLELSNEIGYEWRALGRCLGMTEAELSYVERDNYMGRQKMCFEMLLSWQRRNGTAATYRRLSDILRMIGRVDLSERYIKQAALLAVSQDFEEEAELHRERTKKKTESDILQSYNKLQETVTALLTQRDCEQLLDYFKLTKEHYEATQTSGSSSMFLLDILEERGFIHPADVSALLEALRELKINDRVLHLVETYDRSKDDETSFETFLAALSAHLTLSTPEKLCDYFKFTNEEKEAVISHKSPGLALTMALERKGYINPYDVGRLLPALRERHLVQAAAKVEEYQILVEERSDFKTPAKTLKEKDSLFIKCVKAKIKSWCEGMTPIPWKKSCQWKVSDLFVTRGLTLANKRMETKSLPTKSLSYTDIFTHQDLQDESRLIMEGDPGSGKTMLAFQLAYDWSIGNLNDVKMVMILPLKFLQDMTITEAIAKFYLPKDAPLDKDDIKAILNSANERNKTCIVLDGIEEYNHKSEDGQASAVDTVMNKDQLSNCTVLLTCRSDFEHGFCQFPKLKLGQFGEKERGLYIDRIVPEDKERQQKLKMAIQSSDFLRDICTNALLFVFVVHNIEPLDIKDHLERVGPFMQLMVDNLLSATKSGQSKKDTQGMKHSQQLAEIAFNGLCKGQQILMWQKSFLEKKVPNLKMWIESGILVEEENILMRSGSKEIKLQEKETEEEMPGSQAADQSEQKPEVQLHDHKRRDQQLKLEGGQSGVSHEMMKDLHQDASNISDPHKVSLLVKFLHKVIQEWFAAEHFSSVLKRKILENCHQDFLHKHLRMINPADLHYVLRFTSYLCPFSGHCIMKGLHKVYKGKDGHVPEYIFNCIALCFAEFDSSMEDDNIQNTVKQVLRNAVTIRGEDNRLLQRSKVSMLEYASNSKQINVRCLSLADVLNKVAQEQVTLNSGIILPWLSNLEAVSVCQWAQKLDEVDCRNLLAFITNCSGIKVAILDLPNHPPVLEDETEISKMKSRKMTINWTNGHVNKKLDVNMNQWKITSLQQSLKTADRMKTDLGLEGKSSESTEIETKLASKQPEEELRRLKERYMVAVDGDRQQLLSRLQATTEELEEIKSSLAALQKDFEKTKEVLNSKENELEDTKSSLQTAREELAKSQQQVKSDNEPHTGEAFNKREMSLLGSADHQLSQSHLVRDSPSSAELGDDEVKQIIGKEGGLLKISDTGVSLEIPPGALEESQLIEMRIIRQNYVEEPLSFYNNASVIVELLPNHLELQQEVTLTLPHCIVLKEGIEWKAKVYSSHHDTGSQSTWRVNSEIPSLLTERNCVLWLKSFSRWKFLPDWKIAQGKRIILFAAKKKTSTNRSTLLDVGFYLEHTHAEKRLMKRDVMLDEVEGKLYKKERLPFVVMLVNVEPEHWSCEHKQKTLTFEQIAKANCMYCTFELKGDPNEPEDGTCTFKMWQKEDVCTEFLFHLRDPIPTRSESSAMGSKVLETDLEELSQKIGDSWWIIAGALQLPNADIDNIRDNNKKQEVVAYKILRKWKERNGDSATYSVLVKALRRAGRKDLGDDLETKVNDPSAETDQQ